MVSRELSEDYLKRARLRFKVLNEFLKEKIYTHKGLHIKRFK